jgi:hypothetical protein
MSMHWFFDITSTPHDTLIQVLAPRSVLHPVLNSLDYFSTPVPVSLDPRHALPSEYSIARSCQMLW